MFYQSPNLAADLQEMASFRDASWPLSLLFSTWRRLAKYTFSAPGDCRARIDFRHVSIHARAGCKIRAFWRLGLCSFTLVTKGPGGGIWGRVLSPECQAPSGHGNSPIIVGPAGCCDFVRQASSWMISMAIWSATDRGLRRSFGRMDRR